MGVSRGGAFSLVVALSAHAVRSGRNLGIGVGFGGGFGHCNRNWGSGGREGSGGNHGIWRQPRELAGTTTSDGGGPGLTVKQRQLSTATYNSRDTSPVTFDAVLYCSITYAVLLNLRRIP